MTALNEEPIDPAVAHMVETAREAERTNDPYLVANRQPLSGGLID